MANQLGLTIIKEMDYRGNQEQWSNQYWFATVAPSDDAAWRAYFDSIVAIEKTLYDASVEVVAGYGYDDNSDGAHAVWSVDLKVSPETPVAGTCSITTPAILAPGDAAFWIRWKTGRRNSKGKPIYLRKYYHGAAAVSNTLNDQLATSQRNAALAFAETLDGTDNTYDGLVGRGHISDTIESVAASTYITTRTLKRRGKRTPS